MSECEFEVVIGGGVDISGIDIAGETPVGVILRTVENSKVTTQWPVVPIRPKATDDEINAVCQVWSSWLQLYRPLEQLVPPRDQLCAVLATVRRERDEATIRRHEVAIRRRETQKALRENKAKTELVTARESLAMAKARLAKAEAEAPEFLR